MIKRSTSLALTVGAMSFAIQEAVLRVVSMFLYPVTVERNSKEFLASWLNALSLPAKVSAASFLIVSVMNAQVLATMVIVSPAKFKSRLIVFVAKSQELLLVVVNDKGVQKFVKKHLIVESISASVDVMKEIVILAQEIHKD